MTEFYHSIRPRRNFKVNRLDKYNRLFLKDLREDVYIRVFERGSNYRYLFSCDGALSPLINISSQLSESSKIYFGFY